MTNPESISPLDVSQEALDGTSTIDSIDLSQGAAVRHLFERTQKLAINDDIEEGEMA